MENENENKEIMPRMVPKVEEETKTEPVEPKVEESETVEIKKDELNALIQRLERLEKTANKARLSNYDSANTNDITRVYKMREIDGKVITSWRTISDNVYRDPVTKRIIEDQTLEVTYEDEKKEVLELITFNRRYKFIYATLVSEEKLSKKEDIAIYGDRIYKLETSEGKKYSIGSNFVN